eukprot:NODE_1051_length_2447_cov_0.590290.p1 type:complete len:360 gc:universal NODE_1051_length_2447_cov_0.590290:477-1556(+)
MVIYAVALYDFEKESDNELKAKEGDKFLIVARANEDWFLAKPIETVGQPGLIPVNYVEARDPKTDSLIDEETLDALPTVEEWKNSARKQKQMTIPLGSLYNDSRKITSAPVTNVTKKSTPSNPLPQQRQYHSHMPGQQLHKNGGAPLGKINFASVIRYDETEPNVFEFVIKCQRESQYFILYRQYEDFFSLQLSLLNAFPDEAGKRSAKRIIPYMPGPVDNVTREVTEHRLIDLDTYVRDLLRLPTNVSQSEYTKEFFRPREYDHMEIASRKSTSQTTQLSLKIKMIKQDEIIAIRCNPKTINYANLVNKIYEKLYEGQKSEIKITERHSRTIIDDDDSLQMMIDENPEKMVLFITDME